MEGKVRENYDQYQKNSFWKKNNRAVPGRLSPRKEGRLGKVMSGSSSFQDFQESVNDAWDAGDDDIVCGMADTKISRHISLSAALNVINTHRSEAKSSVVKSDTKKVEVPRKPEASSAEKGKDFSPSRSNPSMSPTAPMRHYPGRPRAIRFPTLAAKEENFESKMERFNQLRESEVLDLNELKQLCWSGVPVKVNFFFYRSHN